MEGGEHVVIDHLNTPTEAAAKLGISKRTLGRYVKRRIIAMVKIGRGKFEDAEIQRFIEKRTRKAVV